MDEGYQIVYVDKPDGSIWEAIGVGIHHYNIQQARESQGKPLSFVLYTPEQEIIGGLIGEKLQAGVPGARHAPPGRV